MVLLPLYVTIAITGIAAFLIGYTGWPSMDWTVKCSKCDEHFIFGIKSEALLKKTIVVKCPNCEHVHRLKFMLAPYGVKGERPPDNLLN